MRPPLDQVLALREQVREVTVAPAVEAYVVAITRATRNNPDLELPASPRASVALYRAAQASAVLEGRAFVTPDDVKSVAAPVLEHRLVIDLERSLRGTTAAAVVERILAEVAVPPVTEG